MRHPILLILLAAAGCSSGQSPDTPANRAVASEPADAGIRKIEPGTSTAAREARALVVRYFALVDRRKFADARALWGHGGADLGGDAAALGAGYARYTDYRATVGEPTAIHIVDGQQYVNVGVTVRAKLAKNGKAIEQEGPVMLRRSADRTGGDAESRDWRIWGIDIRTPH